ncbi:MAG: type VII secretion-associated protein [Mycobacterium sp.]
MTVICALGPAIVDTCGDPRVGRAALDGGDGRHVLVGDRPRPLRQVWQEVLAPLLDGADAALLVYPSWWPAPRAETVAAAAAGVVGRVDMASRSAVLVARYPGALVVEIAEHAVLVTGGGADLTVLRRDGPPQVLAQQVATTAAATSHVGPVLIDAPEQVPGAEVLAGMLSTALSPRHRRVTVTGDREMISAAVDHTECPDLPVVRSRRWRWVPAVLLVAGIGVASAGFSPRPGPPAADLAGSAVTALVEGRLTVQVPDGWTVQRVTGGPGSARVQVSSPADDATMLHFTQSRIADTGLAATASVLRRAIDDKPAGAFVDFNPADDRAGRPAVTYREIRPGREIAWTVLVDGQLRISIGCQHATGRPGAVVAACDEAVRTARRLP